MQFSPGDIIQDFEEPFIKNLNFSCKTTHCSNCFRSKSTLQRCGRCKMVYYCNSDCQKIDWKWAHLIECELYLKATSLEIDFAEDTTGQIVRLMCYLKLHVAKAKEYFRLYNGTERCFNDLQDHFAEINNISYYSKALKVLAVKLSNSSLFTEMECSYENVVRLYGVWKINSFSVLNDADTKNIGSIVYVLVSTLHHSCRPNAIRVMDKKFRMQIRCIDAIPVGETPKITYLAGIRDRELRQVVLAERYFFNCECVLCEKEKEGDLVDYTALIAHRSSIVKSRYYTDSQLIDAKFIVKEMEKLFCRYDERITNFYDHTVERLVVTLNTIGPHTRWLTIPEVKVFTEQAEENLRITFGTEHRDYKYFDEHLASKIYPL